MQLESLLQYLDAYLGVRDFPDFPNALNGLQVEGGPEVRKVVAAVDASEASILEAASRGADLMVVHHGLFWEGLQPLTGRLLRRVGPLLEHGIGLYSVHLPLDSHAEVGNSALLARALGLDVQGRFAAYQDVEIGWWGTFGEGASAEDLRRSVAEAVDGAPVHLIPGGPDRVERVGVVTGGGASFVGEAVEAGLDALVTGEGSHHTHFDAMEMGIHLLFGGHYATEVFGVQALTVHIAERFDLEWSFIDHPTGL
ncbi:MAG: Nif3-like dinuclear metal center hexameric protein [Gemmatimonadota bacterium]|jgi:dinuclear metal center YbgI/SA1388 family protein